MSAPKTAGCGGCDVRFLTMGNLGGHCTGRDCHRTFRGIDAFDRHQIVSDEGKVICRDPGGLKSADGNPVYDFKDIGGVRYWSLWISPEKRAAHAAFLARVKSTDGDDTDDAE